jgi:hypothetical protein
MLVEIGPEGGRRHNSPLKVPPLLKGEVAEAPPSEGLAVEASPSRPATTTS